MENKAEQFTYLRALPLLWLSLAFLSGILLASLFAAQPWLFLLLASLAGAAAFVGRKRINWLSLLALLALCILFLGGARYQVAQPQFGPEGLAYYNDTEKLVEITGIVERPPVPKDGYIELLVNSQTIKFSNGQPLTVHGFLLARVDYGVDLNYGDRLLLSGGLTTPTEYEDFSYRDYLARQGVYSLMPFAAAQRVETGQGNPFWAALYALRERGVEILYRLYPAREAALLSGILLGDESGLSENMKTVFNNTGTRHIIAISGFNISIIAGLLLTLFGHWLGASRGAWLAGIGIALYTLLVGADATVVRAAIMGVLALVALQTGRQSFALNTLGFSAAVMALVNPLVLWDIGFQLSFAATLGLVLFSEPLGTRANQWMEAHLHADWEKRLSKPINDYLLLTLAAQLTTLPILLYYFQRLSILSLPANLLILPAQPALMVIGGLSVIAGMVFLPIGHLIAYFGWVLAAYTIRIVEFFAGLPWASQTLSSFPITLVIAYFAILAVLSVPAMRQRIKLIRVQPVIVLAVLVAFSFWSWNAALSASDGKLHLTLLDLEGEALLIRTPDGRDVLINTGGSANQLLDELSRSLPLGEKVDWVVLAGRRSDQIGGLAGAFERLSPGAVGWAIEGESELFIQIPEQAVESGIAITRLHPGDQFDLGQEAHLIVVSAGERGAILLLEWKNFRALLPLGLDFNQMEQLKFGADIGHVDLLMLSDSGYLPLNPAEWLGNLSPSIAWIDVEDEVPLDEMVHALEGTPVYRSDENGWLEATTDGDLLWLEIERQ